MTNFIEIGRGSSRCTDGFPKLNFTLVFLWREYKHLMFSASSIMTIIWWMFIVTGNEFIIGPNCYRGILPKHVRNQLAGVSDQRNDRQPRHFLVFGRINHRKIGSNCLKNYLWRKLVLFCSHFLLVLGHQSTFLCCCLDWPVVLQSSKSYA